MSENRDVNIPFNEHIDVPHEVSQLFGGLTPQPLEVNRDELFFQAGFMIGNCSRHSRYLWASVALLLVSICLSAALVRESNSINRLLIALAGAKNEALLGATATVVRSIPAVDEDRLPADSRQWQRLASPERLPPGRLTAMGWDESPREISNAKRVTGNGTDVIPAEEGQAEPTPDHPATYLELMRLQREG